MAYEHGAAGAALSGAGPSVLAICDSPISAHAVEKAWNAAGLAGMATRLRFDTDGARLSAPEAGPMSLVTLTGIAKSHGAQHLFDGVNLQISAGRRIAIVGPNGAGKTTLLEIITGEQEADAGTRHPRQGPGDRLPAPGGGAGHGPQRRGRGAGGRRRGERDRAADAAHRGGDGRGERRSDARTSWPS